VPSVAPALAVEVLSDSNTPDEMARKRQEYFDAGTKLVWEVELDPPAVRVYTAPEQFTTLGIDDTLDGGDVLPGFTLSIREWFARALREGPG
jgi:Uma2 family endonuclease